MERLKQRFLGKKDEKEEPNFGVESITPEFDVKERYALVNGVHHRIVKAVGYPRKVEDCWLEAFLSASEPYDISLHIHPSTISSTLVDLHNQIIKQTSDLYASTMKGTPNPSLEIKKNDTMRVYEALYKGEEKMFQVSLYVDNKANSLKELDLLTEKCNANMNAQLIIPKSLDFRMADGIKSMLPLAIDSNNARKEFLTASLSATFPFLYPVDSRKKGLFFAHERNTLNPLFIDFDSMSNKHFFVLGISGSGKSYTSKFLLMQQLLSTQAKVYILDPNAEYKQLTQKMKGEIVELSKKSNSIINLFDLAGEDFGSKMLTLISVFDIITGGLTESQKGVLNEALVRVYKSRKIEAANPLTWINKPPTFSDLKKVLAQMMDEAKNSGHSSEEKSIEVLLNRVKMYSKDGFFSFLDKETKLDLHKNFINFDLSELPPQVKQLVMFSVLELISREIKKDKHAKIVLIDEGWSLLRSKEAENYILEFIKTSRKYNTSIGFITQEIEDLLRSDGGKSILNTTSTKLLLKQNSSNLDLISKSLALNTKERDYLLRANKGQGLLITEYGRYEFIVTAPPKIHDLITTDPNEKGVQVEADSVFSGEEKEKIDVSRGFYALKDITSEQAEVLRQHGYVMHQSLHLSGKGRYNLLVKRQGKESAEHALLTWIIADEIRKRGGEPIVAATVDPDVSLKLGDKTICFEVETGENLVCLGHEYLQNKIAKRKQQYNQVIVVVSDRLLKTKYQRITGTDTITRTEIIDALDFLYSGSYNS